jgi:protein gp37
MSYQCKAANVPFLFKQWGEWAEAWGDGTHLVYMDGRILEGTHDHPDAWKSKTAVMMRRVGKKRAGRMLDGVTHDEYPEGGK